MLTSSFDGEVIDKGGVAVNADGHIHIRLQCTCVWENRIFRVFLASLVRFFLFCGMSYANKYETTGICLAYHPYGVECRRANNT